MDANSIPSYLTIEEIKRLQEYKLAYNATNDDTHAEVATLHRLQSIRAAVRAGYFNEFPA